jgi:hypothetical protein
MKKYISLFFSLSLVLYACRGNRAAEEIIDSQRMTSLLADLHVVDGGLYGVRQMPDSLFKYGSVRYLNLFNKYHTDSIKFRKSLAYYTSKPPLLQAMYIVILRKLQQRSDSLNKLQSAFVKRTDSLYKIKTKKTLDSLNEIKSKNARPGVPSIQMKIKQNALPQK